MLIKDTVMDQRASLDHQCDLVASISHWDVTVVGKQEPVDVDSAERRVEGWAELLGQQDPHS